MASSSTTPHGREEDTGRFVSPMSRIARRYIQESITPNGKRFKCCFEQDGRKCNGDFGHSGSAFKHVRERHATLLQPVPMDILDDDESPAILETSSQSQSVYDTEDNQSDGNVGDLPAPEIEEELCPLAEVAGPSRASTTPYYDLALSTYLRQTGASDTDAQLLLDFLRLGVPDQFDYNTSRIIARNRSRVETVIFCQVCQMELADKKDDCLCDGGGSEWFVSLHFSYNSF